MAAVARYFTMDERLVPDPVNPLVLELAASHRLTYAELGRLPLEGNPSIAADVPTRAADQQIGEYHP